MAAWRRRKAASVSISAKSIRKRMHRMALVTQKQRGIIVANIKKSGEAKSSGAKAAA